MLTHQIQATQAR